MRKSTQKGHSLLTFGREKPLTCFISSLCIGVADPPKGPLGLPLFKAMSQHCIAGLTLVWRSIHV